MDGKKISVPFVNLAKQTAPLLPELMGATERVLRSGRYILGPEVEAFEAECAAYFGVPYAIGVNSGTDALMLAIRAIQQLTGVQGTVVVPAMTFVASAAAVLHADGALVFADIFLTTGMMPPLFPVLNDPNDPEDPTCEIFMPVHLYGAPYPGMSDECWRTSWIIEDAAEAFGARWPDGQLVGTKGTVGCFSFVPTKNLGGYGDGGLVITRNESIAIWVRRLRDHGRVGHTTHFCPGYNSRLDELQAALLRVKLPHIEGWNQRRREIVQFYQKSFSKYNKVVVFPKVEGEGSYQVCVILVPPRRRDVLYYQLIRDGIEVKLHYDCPVPEQPAFQRYVREGQSFLNAKLWSQSCLTLPNFPEMTQDEIGYVTECVLREVNTW